MSLAFPGAGMGFVAFFAMVPLFFALEGKGPKAAFLLAYLAGVVFFAATVYWLVHVTLLGTIVLILYLALYFGLFGALASLGITRSENVSSRVLSYVSLLLVPGAWVTCEWLRSHIFTGFGWACLGYSQCSSLPIIQMADITGVYGISFIIVMVNIAIFLTIKSQKEREGATDFSMILAMVIVFMCLGYGFFRMNNIFTGDKITVGVVQGNIPQDEKWDDTFRDSIISKYVSLTKELTGSKPDLVIWPETSVPGFVESEPYLLNKVRGLVREIKTPLLVGTLREDAKVKDLYYNSASLFLPDGTLSQTYDKIHLVPFGEYVPLKKSLFSFVEKIAPAPIGDVTKGKEYTVFTFPLERRAKEKDVVVKLTKKVKFSCLICFEDMFPDISRQFVARGAYFLVNMTNDAWYKRTSAAWQHMQGSILRAVENRTAVVRATNTGISCFIDQKGKVCDILKDNDEAIFIKGYAASDIVMTNIRTFYNIYGDVFAYLCICSTLLLLYLMVILK